MPEFSQHKSSKRKWYGPPFYTHPEGYKMCIGASGSAHSDGAGTHVSVYAYLMQGRNDDNLPWSFTASHCSTNWKIKTTTLTHLLFHMLVMQVGE